MVDTESQKSHTEINPRSTTISTGDQFIKTSNELNLQTEAEELKRLKEFDAGTPHIHVPEFLWFDTETNQLSTRLISSSQSFYNMIWNNSSIKGMIRGKKLNKEILFLRIEELGQWLKSYHNSTKSIENTNNPSEQLVTLFNSKIETVRKQKNFEDGYLNKIKAYYLPAFEKLSDSHYLENHNISICRIHGDFNVSNMLVDDDLNIHILDFADTRIGFNIEDIGRFYELLWTMEKASIIHRKTLFMARNIFLKSYGFSEKMLTTPVFSAIFALNTMISCITEYTTKEFIRKQFITQLEYKLLTRLSINKIVKEVNRANHKKGILTEPWL